MNEGRDFSKLIIWKRCCCSLEVSWIKSKFSHTLHLFRQMKMLFIRDFNKVKEILFYEKQYNERSHHRYKSFNVLSHDNECKHAACKQHTHTHSPLYFRAANVLIIHITLMMRHKRVCNDAVRLVVRWAVATMFGSKNEMVNGSSREIKPKAFAV